MNAPLIPGTLPVAYCYPANVQVLLNDFMNLSHAEVPDNITGVVFGPTEPGASFPLWYNTTLHRMFEWNSSLGVRIAPYWADADPDYRIFSEKTEAQILAWDNPSSGAAIPGATTYTGPFWAVDHNYDGRFVLGPGNLPVLASTVLIGGTGGADAIEQQPEQVARHKHFITVGPESGDSSYLPDVANENGTFKVNGAEQIRFYDLPSPEVGQTRLGGGNSSGVVEKMNIMPPYRAAFAVKRTARLYYTVV